MADSNVTQFWEAKARLVKRTKDSDTTPSKELAAAIEGVRDDLFGAMAMIGVAKDSIDPELEYDLQRLLEDVYKRFEAIGLKLSEVSGAVARLVVFTAPAASLPDRNKASEEVEHA